MTGMRTKSTPLRLNFPSYAKLTRDVLQRDNWRCQICGTMVNLEVHHQQFRSRGGSDSESNLITLCNGCHRAIHRG